MYKKYSVAKDKEQTLIHEQLIFYPLVCEWKLLSVHEHLDPEQLISEILVMQNEGIRNDHDQIDGHQEYVESPGT